MNDIKILLARLPILQLQCHIELVCGDESLYINGFDGSIAEEGSMEADAVVRISEDDLLAVLSGEANAVSLFTSGKIQVEGDMTVAFKLKDIFG